MSVTCKHAVALQKAIGRSQRTLELTFLLHVAVSSTCPAPLNARMACPRPVLCVYSQVGSLEHQEMTDFQNVVLAS